MCAKLANNFNVSTIAAKVYIIYGFAQIQYIVRYSPRMATEQSLIRRNIVATKWYINICVYFSCWNFTCFPSFRWCLVIAIAVCILHSACTTLLILKSMESNEIKLNDVISNMTESRSSSICFDGVRPNITAEPMRWFHCSQQWKKNVENKNY